MLLVYDLDHGIGMTANPLVGIPNLQKRMQMIV